MRGATWAVPVLLVMGGCVSVGPGPGVRQEVEENRTRWEAARPAAYRYTLRRSCFCLPDVTDPVVIQVAGTTVTERAYAETGGAVSEQFADLFPSVDGLFDLLKDALDRDAFSIRVTWDPATGVPVEVYIDYDQQMADEEQGFTVTSLPEARSAGA